MSSRQMRRLQDLVDRATGLDASDEDEGDDTLPSTMQVKKASDRHHDKKKSKKEKKKHVKETEDGEVEKEVNSAATTAKAVAPAASSSAADPVTSPTERTAPKERKVTFAPPSPAGDDWEEVEDDDGSDDNAHDASRGSAHHHHHHHHQPNHHQLDTGSDRGKKHHPPHSSHGEDEAAAARAAAAQQAEEEKKRKKAEKRKLRQHQQRQRQAEEEALLDAALARNADTGAEGAMAGDSAVADQLGSGSGPASPNSASAGGEAGISASSPSPATAAADSSLQQFVMACDEKQLDTRLERIRMFGADAVEDVGDGRTSHRRADGRARDTGSVSFFPAHHMNVKFVHSAFATPNRYRWVPYDSLGVYLTTEETRDSLGRVAWREYTLVCTSNAFQRALAALGACQDRMGGVQDLVACLASNKVYHIPTLLQCVYAMEATGESAFAGELLDVALYQVGVLLRRFALSGTWSQRQLPLLRGGNALFFQVLQRGVHAALKRGCLRTAFERTRCVLSLDQRDPCGMLLLLDYTALRAKRWVWLLELRHRVVHSAGDARDSALERSIKALPNFAFSWALAKHFIEREEQRQATEAGGRPSKVLRGMTEAQRAMLQETPSAEQLLTTALARFPHAATRLVDALGGLENVCGGDVGESGRPISDSSLWLGHIVATVDDEDADDAQQQGRIAELFVARHEELWKLNECISLLRTALRTLTRLDMRAMDLPSSPVSRNSALLDPYAYVDLTQESVLGASVAPIPADLLQPDAAELAMAEQAAAEFNNAGGGVQPNVEDLMQMLRENLETFGENEVVRNMLEQIQREFGDYLEHAPGGDAEAAEEDEDAHGGAIAGRQQQQRHDAGADLEWYDYDDEEAEGAEGQEWYSVASEEDRGSDEGL